MTVHPSMPYTLHEHSRVVNILYYTKYKQFFIEELRRDGVVTRMAKADTQANGYRIGNV